MGDSEVESFLETIRRGLFEIDIEHPGAQAYQTALMTYNLDKMASAVPSPHIEEYMKGAIDTALSQGVIKPSRVYLEKLSNDIRDKKVTEHDIDRVEGLSKEKNYVKVILNKFADKTLNQLVEELFSAIKTHGLPLVLLLLNLAK